MVQMHHHRHIDIRGQRAQQCPPDRQGHVRPCAGAGLQDHRRALGLRSHDVGARVLPAQADEPRHRKAAQAGRAQHLRQRCKRHLNFATMSMMPGMVCSCAAWVGWKYWRRLRWLCPPRMVK